MTKSPLFCSASEICMSTLPSLAPFCATLKRFAVFSLSPSSLPFFPSFYPLLTSPPPPLTHTPFVYFSAPHAFQHSLRQPPCQCSNFVQTRAHVLRWLKRKPSLFPFPSFTLLMTFLLFLMLVYFWLFVVVVVVANGNGTSPYSWTLRISPLSAAMIVGNKQVLKKKKKKSSGIFWGNAERSMKAIAPSARRRSDNSLRYFASLVAFVLWGLEKRTSQDIIGLSLSWPLFLYALLNSPPSLSLSLSLSLSVSLSLSGSLFW